jgi:hypothetical protein
MATTIGPQVASVEAGAGSRASSVLTRALVACGLLYAVSYPVVNDVIAAGRYEGYSRMSQAVSELSATGAPTQTLLLRVGPIFSLLLIGFGAGIWRSAGDRRSLRVTGALVLAHGAMSVLWMFAPMSRREVIAAGGATDADTWHLVLSAATGLFVAATVIASAFAFGWAYKVYAAVTVAAALGLSMMSAQVADIEAGRPTPSMGWLERAGIGAWLLWMAVLAIALLRRPVDGERSVAVPPRHAVSGA